MSVEDTLQLNFHVGVAKNTRKKQSFSQKRGKRIKERKNEKFKRNLKQQTDKITSKHSAENHSDNKSSEVEDSPSSRLKSENEDSVERKANKRKSDNEHSGSVNKKGKTENRVYISSLFRYNPEIPVVQRSDVQNKTEEVFSSKCFSNLNLHPFMISNLEERFDIKQMTRVQQLAIPPILEGHDCMVKSQTGAGKTLVFTVPIVHRLQEMKPKISRTDGVYALVIVPTRELAIQCMEYFQKLVNPFQWIVPGCLIGGENRKSQKSRLRKGINILVSTPGRLIDHIHHTSNLDLSKIKWFVLDEADRMLDLGYEKDVAEIISVLDKKQTKRQTVLLSATLSDDVKRLGGISLRNPCKIDGDTISQETKQEQGTDVDIQSSYVIPEKLKQYFVITPCKLRLVTLTAFILLKLKLVKNPGKMVVFLSTQDSVEFHHKLLEYFFGAADADEDSNFVQENDLDFFKIHGDMAQKDRTKVYQDFCKANTGVLLCTDVAARGLHLPNVRWIVQYTTPGATSDYIHRVGRTARIGKQGHALLFLMPAEVGYIKSLEEQGISMEEMSMSDILKTLIIVVQDMVTKTEDQRSAPRSEEDCATYLQTSYENYIHEDSSMSVMARKAYQSFVRAYATYPSSLKSIFHIKNLHLGHLAKSFGLRDAPSNIGGTLVKHGMKHKQKKDKSDRLSFEKDKKMKKKFSAQTVSEFASGLTSKKVSTNKIKMSS